MNLREFVKHKREFLKLTQLDLSLKAGVGIRFVRELEGGKSTLRMDKVNQVLDLFGFELTPSAKNSDAETQVESHEES